MAEIMGELRSMLAAQNFHEIESHLSSVNCPWWEIARGVGYVLSCADQQGYEIGFDIPPKACHFSYCSYGDSIFSAAYHDRMHLIIAKKGRTYPSASRIIRMKRWHKRFNRVAAEMTAQWFGLESIHDTSKSFEEMWQHFKSKDRYATSREEKDVHLMLGRIFSLMRHQRDIDRKGKVSNILMPRAIPKRWIRYLTSLTTDANWYSLRFQRRYLQLLREDFLA